MPRKIFTNKFINFNTPIDLITAYDPRILNEQTTLHSWQYDFLDDFARDIPDNDLLMQALIAANGSGKSKYILAPSITWMAMNFDNCLCYVTSSSATQLDTQTERYVNQICEAVNKEHNEELWEIKQRSKIFKPTGSFIDLYATDEAKRAEGKHPLVDGAEFGIFGDECKSITDEIFGAMDRCTGASRKLYSSSPGGTRGEFYKVCTAAGSNDFKSKNELGWNVMRVTSFDCSHIKNIEIELLIKKHGLNDPWVRSAIFAEFSSIDERTVIAYETVKECVKHWNDNKIIPIYNGVIRAGLDISRGGDEMVLSIWKNNIQIGEETCRHHDSVQGRKTVMDWINKWRIPHGENNTMIWADDGGMGATFIDELKEAGYYCRRVLNNSKPYDQTRYANRGTELYFNFKRFIEEGQVKFKDKDSEVLQSQLSNRYYKLQPVTEKLILESKDEARRKGHSSPDRADACVLAWTGLSYPLEDDPASKPTTNNKLGCETIDELDRKLRSQLFEGKLQEMDNLFSGDKNHITQQELIERMHAKEHGWRKYLLGRN